MSQPVEHYIQSTREEFEETLGRWVAMPTISAFPEQQSSIESGAASVAADLNESGADARVVPTPGNPVVIAKFDAGPSDPTVTVYNHLDVQPADEPDWRSDPFRMEIRDHSYVGRGTTDDKGPALTAFLAARYAKQAGVPLNIRFLWEFEEEIGSPNFETLVENHQDDLATDSVVVSDTIWISRERPAMPFGLRGLLSARVSLETGTKDVHSGLTGGAARNPVSELCSLMGRCHDVSTGRIQIPGFYERVQAIAADEIDEYMQSGFDIETFRKAHGLLRMKQSSARHLMRQIWTRPTFEVHSIVGGYQGPGVKTAIAPRAEAKVSMRLVPDQSPDDVFQLFRDFVAQECPDAVVEKDGSLRPFLGTRTGPFAEAGREAMRHAFGQTPAAVREGGSIGAVVTMSTFLKAPIIFLGLSLPEHGYHAPNEHFDWEQASGGMRMFIRYFENISRL